MFQEDDRPFALFVDFHLLKNCSEYVVAGVFEETKYPSFRVCSVLGRSVTRSRIIQIDFLIKD